MSDVKRYRLCYKCGVIDDGDTDCQHPSKSIAMVPASAHDRAVGELVEALQCVLAYTRHDGDCGFGSNNSRCSCGALATYKAANAALAKYKS